MEKGRVTSPLHQKGNKVKIQEEHEKRTPLTLPLISAVKDPVKLRYPYISKDETSSMIIPTDLTLLLLSLSLDLIFTIGKFTDSHAGG
jgi:hypothetical protein